MIAVHRCIEVDRLLSNHSYNLSELSRTYISEMQMYQNTCLICEPTVEECMKFPGLISTNADKAEQFYDSLNLSNSDVKPRGCIDKGSTAVVGIAPGCADIDFVESVWLYGPSSKLLHQLLSFNNKWYFTNVCRNSFPRNKYNEAEALKYVDRLASELSGFEKVIFLGNYRCVYDKVIKKANLKKVLFLQHPSYISRSGDEAFDFNHEKAIQFARGGTCE